MKNHLPQSRGNSNVCSYYLEGAFDAFVRLLSCLESLPGDWCMRRAHVFSCLHLFRMQAEALRKFKWIRGRRGRMMLSIIQTPTKLPHISKTAGPAGPQLPDRHTTAGSAWDSLRRTMANSMDLHIEFRLYPENRDAKASY
jgi:hypothetical protein